MIGNNLIVWLLSSFLELEWKNLKFISYVIGIDFVLDALDKGTDRLKILIETEMREFEIYQ